jgi:4-hydroxythreonine-4-phosphate dehydrogenase
VGITLGDPAGIGPEIVIKALRHARVRSLCRPIVFGTARLIQDVIAAGASGPDCVVVESPDEAPRRKGTVSIVDVPASLGIRAGRTNAAAGKAAVAYLDRAIRAAIDGEIDALVTAPVSKAAIRQNAVPGFIGHTEYLAQKTMARAVAMMFYSEPLKVVLVTTHLPLKKVSASITAEKVLNTIRLSEEALKKLGCARPRVGVAGVNPHAGEEDAFGTEDSTVVAAAVRSARRRGIDARGPLPADTLFRAALAGDYDLVVAMYHDQALAPFKMIAFDEGVNVTLGLPFVRTSVDHGTAFDIAGRGIASEKSLVEAIRLAARLST